MEQENIILKRQTKEQSEAIQTIKSQTEQLQQNSITKKLIQKKSQAHKYIELPKIQEHQSQQHLHFNKGTNTQINTRASNDRV